MMVHHIEEELKECVREKTQKDEIITKTKLAKICDKDYRTVENHFSNIVGRDLGDGTHIAERQVCTVQFYRDPPGDERTAPSDFRPALIASLVFTLFALAVVCLAPRHPVHATKWILLGEQVRALGV